MSVDFYSLNLEINYNNNTPYAAPNEFEAGWTESYDMPVSNSINQNIVNGMLICAARASCLARNYYIFRAEIHQESVFRSRYRLPNFSQFPVWDTVYQTDPLSQYCNDPEAAYMVRFEAANMRRWERQFRGIKDYMANDTAFANSALGLSMGPSADGIDIVFPTIQPTGLNGAVEATFTVTNTAGVLSLPIAATPGSGYGLGAAGTWPLVFTDPLGLGSGAVGTVTLTAGAVSGVSITSGGTGYSTGTTLSFPAISGPNGILQYQSATTYWRNFLATLVGGQAINGNTPSTGTGQRERVANAAFPSGFMTQLNNTDPLAGFYAITRTVPQRIGNRQTGQIRLISKARVKRGI